MDKSEVTKLLASAVDAVDASGAKDDLRVEAFKAAVGLLSGPTAAPAGPLPPAPAQGPGLAAPTPAAPKPPEDSTDPLDRVAAFLGCDPADAHRIFAVQDGVPELKVPTKVLPAKKGRATPEIALLVMAARQGALVDDYTAANTLRDAVKAYSKLDPSNHARYVDSLDHLVLKKGSGRGAERKLTRPGIEAAASKVAEYAASAAAA